MELLKKLCETPGISGYEGRIQKVIKEELEKVTDEVRVDKLGNVTGIKRAEQIPDGIPDRTTPKRVMVAAHMDEVGLVIKYIDDNGFLRFFPLGGFDLRTLFAQKVIIHGKRDTKGVIGSKSVHLLKGDGGDNPPKIQDLFIDTGLKKDEISKIVNIGDPVTLVGCFERLNDEIIIAKAFDDRVGVYVMIEVLKRIKDCYVDIYAGATVQEEIGEHRGATVSSFSIGPDIGIALDIVAASDLPNIEKEEKSIALGGGTVITLIDSLYTISNRKIVDSLKKIAEDNKIKYQIDVKMKGGTDAGAMQLSKAGAPVCIISIPVRYTHTIIEMCHKDDIEDTIKLVTKYLEEIK